MSGKGSGRRPADAPDDVVTANWNAIFGKKDSDVSFADVPDDKCILSAFTNSVAYKKDVNPK